MQKDFDGWNSRKKNIHSDNKNRFCRARQIWWCLLGLNVGFEQDGAGENHERPVLILKSFSAQTCLVVPLTTSIHTHPMRIPIGNVDGEPASVIMSQIRVIDTKRLINRIGYLDKEKFEIIRKVANNLV